MGKIVSSFFISLDGVVEAPDQWHFPYFNDEMGAVVANGVAKCSAFLMGRKLYEEWAAYWPTQARIEPEAAQDAATEFASFINNIPKYVVSSTLTTATWNNTTIINGDVAGRIQKLKDSTAGDINLSGSATLVRWLLANGLLDELNILLHPIAVGHGQRLFEDTPTHPLELLSSKTFQTGVLHLVYAPANR